jgi:hypothetical protein
MNFPVMNEISRSKSIFKSKTAFAGVLVTLAGAVGSFAPGLAPWIAAHADLVLMAAGILQVGLRMVTKGSVNLFGESD